MLSITVMEQPQNGEKRQQMKRHYKMERSF